MRSTAIKNGGVRAANGSTTAQIRSFGSEAGINGEQTREQLRQMAREVMSGISEIDPFRSQELIGIFVSELFLLAVELERREFRRQKQAEGIAAAKARGVRFGPQRRTLPDGFEELRQAWRKKEITLRTAAELCGVPKTTFREAALRAEMAAEQSADCVV